MDFSRIKQIGTKAIYSAAEILKNYYGKLDGFKRKGAIDLVTVADIESEKIIIKTIHDEFPDHSILSEEDGEKKRDEKYQWVIDPLDGTTNFVHGIKSFSVSISFMYEKKAQLGFILNPLDGEFYFAQRNQGAYLNGNKIQVSAYQKLDECLLVTGFPYNLHDILPEIITRFSNCLKEAQGVRRLGSAALDLCYLACGRFDAFWEQNLKPWDTAAGYLIVKEAGGTITDFSNNDYHIYMDEILATNGNIHEKMMSLLKIKET